MLKTIDIYIIKKFLSSFLFTVLIFTMISVVIDFSEKVKTFIKEDITLKEIVVDYYFNFILNIDGMLWPLFTLIAVIFFTSRMAYNSEIISIFNAGVSFTRYMVPYLISASFICILHLLGTHFLIPMGNKKRVEVEIQHIYKNNDKGKTNDVHLFVAPGTKVYVQMFRKGDNSVRGFRMERFENGELVYLLNAEKAEWLGPPHKWKISNYTIRRFDGLKEELENGKGMSIDTSINFTPDDFKDYVGQETMLPTPELKRYIAQQQQRGAGNTQKYIVELYRRTAEPFTIFILTIIGVSIASRKVRGGLGLHLAFGLSIASLYIVLSRFSSVFAAGQVIPVSIGMWIPNLVFTLVALGLIRLAQK